MIPNKNAIRIKFIKIFCYIRVLITYTIGVVCFAYIPYSYIALQPPLNNHHYRAMANPASATSPATALAVGTAPAASAAVEDMLVSPAPPPADDVMPPPPPPPPEPDSALVVGAAVVEPDMADVSLEPLPPAIEDDEPLDAQGLGQQT